MNEPRSRLLLQLHRRISEARDQYVADCIRAERVCYLARQGTFTEAQAEVQILRKKYAGRDDAEIFVWLNLAEGLISYFGELGHTSRDKVLRAHALSAATGLVRLNSLTAAWLAQMDFSRLDAPSVARHVSESLLLSNADQHAPRFRASLVVAQSLHLAGRWDLASRWYTRARMHATEEGDELSVSALMHNMVSMRLDHFRQVILTGVGEEREAAFALVGIESSVNFDLLIGTSTLEATRPLMRARFLSLRGRTNEALRAYEECTTSGASTAISRLESEVSSDIALCQILEGDTARALANATIAESSLTEQTQIDDRAATHTRLSKVYSILGDLPNANRHELLANASWQQFATVQEQFVSLLGRLSENGVVT